MISKHITHHEEKALIIVTGAAGFIGSNIVEALNLKGHHDVWVCDRLRDGEKWRNIAEREVEGFIQPSEFLDFIEKNAEKIEIVFHMGAISATTETDGDRILEANVCYTNGLLDWATKHQKRVIYASSAATYGDGQEGYSDENSCEALAKLKPLNLYGWSKHVVDRRLLRKKQRGEALPAQWVGLKFFNVYGPREDHKAGMMSVVCRAHPTAAAGEVVKLFKSHHPDYRDGGQLRDFVYVKDCVAVMMWMLEHPEVSGIFNLGTGEARSFDDLVHALFSALEMAPRIEYIDMPEKLRGKYQYYTQAEMARLREVGYKAPMTSLEDGVRDYVLTHLNKMLATQD